MTHTIHETQVPFADIQRALYQTLEYGPLTVSKLAHALADYFPDKSTQELEDDCQRMLNGIYSGMEYCDRAEQMQEDDIDQELAARLHSALEGKSPQEQKQYLIQLFSIFYSKSGSEITPDLAVYIAGMDHSQLLDEVVCLLHQEGRIAGVQLLDAVDHRGGLSHEDAQLLQAYAPAFTAQEHMWISAASMYAAGAQQDNPVTDPEAIGRQVGFLGRFLQTTATICKRYVVPTLVDFLCSAGCYLLVNCGADWMLAGETALASLAFFGADSVIPGIIASVVGSLGLSLALMALISGISLSVMYLLYNALDDLSNHAQAMNEKAGHEPMLKTAAAPSVAEPSHHLQPTYQTTGSHHEPVHSV